MLKRLVKQLSQFKIKRPGGEKGQSLVEIAVATPLLLFMLLGVFEVGWALRGYIVLANMNRETVRFAVKNGVLDYSIKDPTTVGYNLVLSHSTASLSQQLPLEFLGTEPNATIIMSHIVADTALPCAKKQGGKYVVPYEFDPNCDCTVDDPNDPQWFTKDDLILHPDLPGYAYYAQTYGITRTSRLAGGSYAALAEQLALENNQFNCNVLKTAGTVGELSINNMFVAETFYDQPQIFGVPFISNKLTDPVPFYTHTAMRIVTSRDADTTDTIGPTCELLPITFPESFLVGNPPGQQYVEAFEGGASGNFGWMYWNSNINETNGINYIEESLVNPRLSMNDFVADEDDPDYPGDTTLNVGDWIAGRTGVGNSSDIRDLLDDYVGKTVYIPIYDQIGPKPGSGASYHVSHFAKVVVEEICFPSDNCAGIPNNEKAIRVTFLEYADDACTDDSGAAGGPANNDPIATDDSVTTAKNTPVVISVLANDSDPDGDTITVSSVSEVTSPFKGTIAITDGGATITYTPKNNDTGVYQFDYTITDGNGGNATARVTVTVSAAGNNPPVAQDDNSYTTAMDTPLTVAAGSGVLANDTDADGDSLTAIKVTDPANGSVTLNADGSFTYTPNSGFNGNDSFTYKANDGTADSNVATVTISVTGNSPPQAVNDSYTTNEDAPLTVNAGSGVLANDTDPNSDPLTAIKLTDPANGSLTFNADGSFTYTPNANWSGTDSFTYKANDGADDSPSPATVSIIVNPVNDPPAAVDDSYTTNEDTPLTVNAGSGLLANDTDIDTVVLNAIKVTDPANGSVTLNADGSFTYTPNSGFNGNDSFTYKANDGSLDSGNATVTINVTPAAVLTTIAQEDFDGTSTGWSGGGWAYSGDAGVADSSTYTAHSPTHHLELLKTGEAVRTVNMTGVTGAKLKFWWRVDSLDNNGETGEVLVYDGSWHSVFTITRSNNGDPYQSTEISLPETTYNMVSNFQVKFKINASGKKDYFYVDDIEITGYK